MNKGIKSFSFNSTLKTQLMYVLIAVAVIPMILVGIITFNSTINNLDSEKKSTLKAYTEGIANNLNIQLESADKLIGGLSSHSDIMVLLENFNRDPGQVDGAKVNTVVFSLKNVIDSSDKLYETVYISDVAGNVVMDGSKYSAFYKGKPFYSKKDFEEIKNTGRMLVGSPFKSAATGNIVIPVTRPIKSLNGFMGAMTILFDMNKFSAGFDNIKPGNTGEVVVINSENTIIYHTKKELAYTRNEISALENILNNQENMEEGKEFLTYQDNSRDKTAYYIRSGLTGWVVCAQLDKSELQKPVYEFTTLILITVAALLLLIILISVKYSGYISKPLERILGLMKKVEEGDLDIQINFNTAVREIDELKKGFKAMVENLKMLIDEIKGASGLMKTTTSKMETASQESLGQAGQTMEAVVDIRSRIQEQAAVSETVRTGIEEMAGRIYTARSLSEEISAFSRNVNDSSEKGSKLVGILNEKSQENIKSTGRIGSVITILNSEMAEINKIAGSIANIAGKTRLLSLNAAIEAARAGEAGQGFAVVAGEIQSLSDQTSSELKGINSLVENIRGKASELEILMNTVNRTVYDQNDAVQDTKSAFEKIDSAITDISQKIAHITSYLEEMDGEKGNLVELVRSISQLSEQMALHSENVERATSGQMDMFQEVHDYSGTLNLLSQNLERYVEKFKI